MTQTEENVRVLGKEKLQALFDERTFVELGAYTKRSNSETEFESVVCGYGAIGGRLAFAFLQDSARKKGAFGERHAKKIADLYALAVKNGAPMVGVFASAGASVYEGAAALAAYGKWMKTISDASGVIPQIAVIDGVCGGSSAVAASMFDFTVMVKKNAALYVNSPFVIGKEAGTPDFAAANGMSAHTAETTEDAFAFVRSLLDILPQNNADGILTERVDDLNRALTFDPCSYMAEELCRELADGGNFVRLYSSYTDTTVFGLLSIGGVMTGVIASEPSKKGILNIATARAAAKLISFCDSFAIPVLTLVDSEGLDVSMTAESAVYAAELSRLAMAYATSKNAKITVVIGKAYGASFTLLGSKALGADLAYALDGSVISLLSPEASVAFVWNDRVGEESRETLEREWIETRASAEQAAYSGEIDDILGAAELRKRICAGLMMLASKAEGTPSRRHANLPL